MPRLTPAAPDMPPAAEQAHRAIATTTRLEIIRSLLQAPHADMPTIIQATRLPRESIRSALNDLETLPYIRASDPPGARRGRLVTYEVDQERLERDLGALTAYILCDSSPTQEHTR